MAPRGPAEDRVPGTHAQALPQCVTLDKLEAAPSEAALVARSLELLAERRFWAGVVFLGPEDPGDPAGPSGPGHVRMKIRMDIDAVTRTNKIRDRWGIPRAGAVMREPRCEGRAPGWGAHGEGPGG